MQELQTPQPKTTPKEFFLHLLNIASLYVSAVSFITLSLNYIDVLFPDQLHFYLQGILDGILWSTSVLIVAFPVFIGTSWFTERQFTATPERREIRIRKWLVYFTLFVTAISIIGDLILLIYNFLKGELTLPFFLKIVAVLVVAAALFGFYIWDIRRKNLASESKILRLAAWATSGILCIAILGGFFLVGSPQTQRARRFDERRVTDLQTIQGQIVYGYWTNKGALPQTLNDLHDDISGFIAPVDPFTNEAYGYRVTDEHSFELCAIFQEESFTTFPNSVKPIVPAYDPYTQNWEHEKGKTCFSRTIDPQLYKQEEPRPIKVPPVR